MYFEPMSWSSMRPVDMIYEERDGGEKGKSEKRETGERKRGVR